MKGTYRSDQTFTFYGRGGGDHGALESLSILVIPHNVMKTVSDVLIFITGEYQHITLALQMENIKHA